MKNSNINALEDCKLEYYAETIKYLQQARDIVDLAEPDSINMKGFEKTSQSFYTSESDSVQAFYGTSEVRDNLPVIIAAYDLAGTEVDEILNFGLEQAREKEQKPWKILEMQVDVSRAPERYSVWHILQWLGCSAEESLKQELAEREALWRSRAQTASAAGEEGGLHTISDRYQLESAPFYSADNVELFEGASGRVVAKRHQFVSCQERKQKNCVSPINKDQEKMQTNLVSAINAGLAQARASHPHICEISALHFDTSAAPQRYYVYHILEALERDVKDEIQQRRNRKCPPSEAEVWDFLEQLASALASAHAKVSAR